MKANRIAALSTVAACCLTGAAHAAGLTLGTSGFQFTVIDLDPADGNDAAFSLGPATTVLWTGGSIPQQYLIVGDGQPGSVESGAGYFHASASTDGTLGATHVTYSDSGWLGTDENLSIYASGQQEVEVTLAANSMLILNGSTFAQFTRWPGYKFRSEMTIGLGHDGIGPVNTAVRTLYGPGPGEGTSAFQLGYANPFASAVTLHLTVESYVSAQPVPEPSTYVMLAAGLAGIGAIARQRRQAGKA